MLFDKISLSRYRYIKWIKKLTKTKDLLFKKYLYIKLKYSNINAWRFYFMVITEKYLKENFERENVKCLQDNNCFHIYEMTWLFFTCNSVKKLTQELYKLDVRSNSCSWRLFIKCVVFDVEIDARYHDITKTASVYRALFKCTSARWVIGRATWFVTNSLCH